jgi:hypothetical protein
VNLAVKYRLFLGSLFESCTCHLPCSGRAARGMTAAEALAARARTMVENCMMMVDWSVGWLLRELVGISECWISGSVEMMFCNGGTVGHIYTT